MQPNSMTPADDADSPAAAGPSDRVGGVIPGSGGAPAFSVRGHEPSSVPVVIAVPHAGRTYPPALLAALRDPARAAQRLEDRLVDLVGRAVAARTGATLLVANAPRAMIDLNRAPDDLDREMIAPDPLWPDFPPPVPQTSQRRAQGGLGLVPRRLPGLGELWRRRLPAAEVIERIEAVHAPYHAALEQLLAAEAARWGAALLVDLHSMPPLPPREAAEPAPTYVLGDRFGAACAGQLTGAAFACLARAGVPAAHNRPYAGGYTLDRHGQRAQGIHALQIEIDRSAYLDPALAEPGAGLEAVIETVAAMVRVLAGEVAALGEAAQRWPRAAE